jgi:hypothetical protein
MRIDLVDVYTPWRIQSSLPLRPSRYSPVNLDPIQAVVLSISPDWSTQVSMSKIIIAAYRYPSLLRPAIPRYCPAIPLSHCTSKSVDTVGCMQATLVCQTHPCTSEIQTELTRYILLISIDLTSVSDGIRSLGVF